MSVNNTQSTNSQSTTIANAMLDQGKKMLIGGAIGGVAGKAVSLAAPVSRKKIAAEIADHYLKTNENGMADTIMVARCGEAAVSGVSLVDSISNLLITVFSAFATGGAVVISQYLGHKEDDNAKASAVNLIYISAAISLLMTLVILPIRGHVIDFLFGSIEEDVRLSTDEYFVPILLSYPFLAVYSAMTAISRAERKSFRTMRAGPYRPYGG